MSARRIEQSFPGFGIAVEDGQVEARCGTRGGARLLHHIRYPKDCEGEPCQRLTPSLAGRRLDTTAVNRTEDKEAVLVGGLLHQLDPAGCHHPAGICRTLERFPAN